MEYWENIWQSLTNADLDNHIHSANMLSHVNNKTILWWTNSMWSGENIWTFPLNNSGLNFTNVWLFQRDGGVNQGVLNSYCWMYSTFNIPPSFQGNQEPDSMFVIIIILHFRKLFQKGTWWKYSLQHLLSMGGYFSGYSGRVLAFGCTFGIFYLC